MRLPWPPWVLLAALFACRGPEESHPPELLRPDTGADTGAVTGAGPAPTQAEPKMAPRQGPELEPRLEEGERERLRSAAEADLASARKVIEATDTQALDGAQLERFDVLLDLVERAVAALETDRVQEARQLAEKASVLARDLAPRG